MPSQKELDAYADQLRIEMSRKPQQQVIAQTAQSQPGFLEQAKDTVMNGALGAVSGFDQGFSGYTGDEMRAAVESMRKGIPFQEAYQQEKAALQTDKEGSPKVYNVAEFVGGMFSPLGKLVKGAGFAKNVANAAIQGGVSAAGNADGSLADRAVDGTVGAATGAVFSTALQGAGKGLSAVTGRKASQEIATGALGGGRPEIDSMRSALGKDGKSQLGKWLQENKMVKFGEPLQETAQRIGQHVEEVGNKLGGALAVADEYAQKAGIVDLDPKLILNSAMEQVKKDFAGKAGANQAEQLLASNTGPVADFMSHFAGKDRVSLPELHAFRASLGKLVYGKDLTAPQKQAIAILERSFSKRIDSTIKAVSGQIPEKVGQELAKHTKDFQLGMLAKNAVEEGVSKIEGRGNPLTMMQAAGRMVSGKGGTAAARGTEALANKGEAISRANVPGTSSNLLQALFQGANAQASTAVPNLVSGKAGQ